MARELRAVSSAEISAAANRPYWHIRDDGWSQVAAHIKAGAVSLWMDDDSDDPSDCGYTVDPSGAALIPIVGMLVDYEPSWWLSYLGYASIPGIARAVTAAYADPTVTSILLCVDSPGGQVSGLYAACEAVWNARQGGGKKIWGSCKQVCSAAYEIVSQCDQIFVTEDSLDGCIGTVISLEDWSGYFTMQGIIVERVTSTGGEAYKGEATFGTKITAAQKADFKRICDEFRSVFNGVIARGRPSLADKLSALADGRVHVGRNALALGLVDAIATQDEVLAALGAGADTCGSADLPEEFDPDLDDEPTDGRRKTPRMVSAVAPPPKAAALATEPDQGMRQEFRMKERLVKALNFLGLGKMALALSVSTDADPEVMAQTMASQVDAEVKDRVALDPLIQACVSAKILTPADMSAALEMRDLGLEHLKELRAQAHAEAVRCFDDLGPSISAQVDTMSAKNVKVMRDSWAAQADKTFGIGKDKQTGGAVRQTKPGAPGFAASATSEEPEDKPKAPKTEDVYAARRKQTAGMTP